MNTKRRAAIKAIAERLEAIRNMIEEVCAEEQDAFDGMPANLQEAERGEAMQAAIDALQTAYDDVDNVIEGLAEVVDG